MLTYRRWHFVSPISPRHANITALLKWPHRIEPSSGWCSKRWKKSISTPWTRLATSPTSSRYSQWIVLVSFSVKERVIWSYKHTISSSIWKLPKRSSQWIQVAPSYLEWILTRIYKSGAGAHSAVRAFRHRYIWSRLAGSSRRGWR